MKRYIFTTIDKYVKMAYIEMYITSRAFLNGKDFIYRLEYLLGGIITRVGYDNGSELKKEFTRGCVELNIAQYYFRIRNPKDNPDNERFNQTLQTEFIDLDMATDADKFNRNLAEWLIEYSYIRPHQTLNYKTPAEYLKVFYVVILYKVWISFVFVI